MKKCHRNSFTTKKDITLVPIKLLSVLPNVAWSRQSGVFGTPCGVKKFEVAWTRQNSKMWRLLMIWLKMSNLWRLQLKLWRLLPKSCQFLIFCENSLYGKKWIYIFFSWKWTFYYKFGTECKWSVRFRSTVQNHFQIDVWRKRGQGHSTPFGGLNIRPPSDGGLMIPPRTLSDVSWSD